MRSPSLVLLLVSIGFVVSCDDGGQQASSCASGTMLCPDGACRPSCGQTTGAGGGGGAVSTGLGGKGPVDPGPFDSPDCKDTASLSGNLAAQYNGATIDVAGGAKSYYLHSNWWNVWESGVALSYQGLSFTVNNPANIGVPSGDNNPMGYPSLYMGAYSGHNTTGSNLPIALPQIGSVPTVFSTNAADGDIANYNAAYDVWFTASGTPLPASEYSPGTGGAYLMVWLFQPLQRRPRGSKVKVATTIPGVEGTWDVWEDRTDPACISYVSVAPLNGLAFDLNSFIRDSVDQKRGITDSMYLSVVFAGFEIWNGGDALQVKNFCANVKPKG